MSPTKVIFTYKRKRLSSCAGVGHAVVCPDFSSDGQVVKHQDAITWGSESRQKDLKLSSAHLCPQVDKSNLFKENHVEESVTTNASETILGSHEMFGDYTVEASSENISAGATLVKIRNSSEVDTASCSLHVDGYILGASVPQSVKGDTDSPSEQRYLCHPEILKPKLNAPLLTFSRRLKKKTEASSTVMFSERPIREGPATIKEGKSICIGSSIIKEGRSISPCSCEMTSPVQECVDLRASSGVPSMKNVHSQSSDDMICIQTGDSPILCGTSCLGNLMERNCSGKDFNVDTSAVAEQTAIEALVSASPFPNVMGTRNTSKENVQCSLNGEALGPFCDGLSKTVEHNVSPQLRASSGDSQLTSDGLDSKLLVRNMTEQKASSGVFVIDCNVIPECDLEEQASDTVPHSSLLVKSHENTMPDVLLKTKDLEFGNTGMQGDISRLQSPGDACASAEGETKPKINCLQLFSEDGKSDLLPPTISCPQNICNKTEPNATFALNSGTDRLDRFSTKASFFLGLSLPTEPLPNETLKHDSDVRSFQNHVQTREFFQNLSVRSSFLDPASSVFRHRRLLESINGKTTTLRGNRNTFVDKLEPCPSMWMEEELDSLWIGIRRHGRGNWHAMLLDSRLHFAPWRVARDLAVQWEQEQYKLLSGQRMLHGRYVKPPDPYNLECDGFLKENPSAGTELSLGDVYSRREDRYFRNKAQSYGSEQPCKHVRMASCKVNNSSRGLFNNLQTNVMIRGDVSPNGPALGLAMNNHYPHWLREPIATSSRLMEALPLLNSTLPQAGAPQLVHPFQEPFGTSYGPRHLINNRIFGLMAVEAQPPSGFPCAGPSTRKQVKTNNPIVIDSDASSEETISDDHNTK